MDKILGDNKLARIAGAVYLIVVITGIFNLAYVPSQINVRGDIAGTIANIESSMLLYRLGIAVGLISFSAYLLLPFSLFRLLHPVNKQVAVLMVILAMTSVPISFVNLINKVDILSLIAQTGYLQNITTEQLHFQVGVLLHSYSNNMLISQIFWGLWLFPFGYLVYQSQFLPRILGIFLMLGCFGYLIDLFGRIIYPPFSSTLIGGYVTTPASIGEIGICLWLLLCGARRSLFNKGAIQQ